MAAPKGEELLNKLFNEIIIDISENGLSLISALKDKISASTFYTLLEDDQKSQMYARACETRADIIADEIMDISDNVGNDMVTLKDGREVIDNAVVQRDRLRVDSRKWLLSKLHPKKYGEKIDVAHSGSITLPITGMQILKDE